MNTTTIEQYVIDRVREIRTEKGFSQIDLAYALGVTKGFVAAIENPNMRAKYKIDHLNRLATLFECPFANFFPDKPFSEDLHK